MIAEKEQNRIILDLDNSHFGEEYDSKSMWQHEAAKRLVSNLLATGAQARAYRQARDNNSELVPQAVHDAIFVSGQRGAGKTEFLRNADKIWRNSEAKKELGLHFLDVIDPTLLIDHDNFTNVIVAHLYNAVEPIVSNPSCKHHSHRDSLFNKLRLLADALGQGADFADRIGLDRIIKYRSGIQLERFFHDFAEECAHILGSDAIVLPIDDVDMALERSYEVLDVVRRVLGCPFIIPLVSGHETLYQHMVTRQFQKGVDDDVMPKELSAAYLTKVLPNQYRVNLASARELMSALSIKQDNIVAEYGKYFRSLKTQVFGLCNGDEKSNDFPEPESAREIVQLVDTIKPNEVQVEPEVTQFESLKNWAHSKKHGACFVNSESTLTLLRNKNEVPLRLTQLLAFNPKLQMNVNVDWASKDFYSEQLVALGLLKIPSDKTNTEILEGVISGKVMRSMPPLELHTNRMTISAPNIRSERSENTELYNLYTFYNYYGITRSRIHKVFFSRAFEVLVMSLLWRPDTTDNELVQLAWNEVLPDIFNEAPFYCVHAMNPSKYTGEEIGGSEDTDTPQELDAETDQNSGKFAITFSESIATWQQTYAEQIRAFKLSSALPLISAVFNKTFTQLNILRANHGKLDDEHLSDSVIRFRYILINSFASFLSTTQVAKSNITIGATVDTIREHQEFRKREHVFTRNLEGLVDIKTMKSRSGEDGFFGHKIGADLIEMIWHHPIFNCIQTDGDIVNPKAPFTPTGSTDKQRTASNSKSKRQTLRKASLDATRKLVESLSGVGVQDVIQQIEVGDVVEYIDAVKDSVVKEMNDRSLMFNDLRPRYQQLYLALNLG
ncbi:antiviral RADAR system adenosine triphosphatase RdrA [Shewanella sp. GutDb-MelDb]|uniref:antiviral RADAR system adenosine triphosphatase RdrA n=1 Tax=Shewanella sp. GutDb-MelDb TaxID=2058316 RepID=UPI000C7CE866|nr:antiviral RADAR system adenosine triphosphatase RdrA [Shewanella sp. GutDb-MelDb]PKG58105.1 hypothetical protein CXF82_06180 [Shewanella sp. GutDb-MelDb]